jgi:hypothetical protein
MDRWDKFSSTVSLLAFLISVNLLLHEVWRWAGVSAAVGFCLLFLTLPRAPDASDE